MTRMSYAKQATVQLWSNFGLFSLGVKHYVLHAATENSRFSSSPSLHFFFSFFDLESCFFYHIEGITLYQHVDCFVCRRTYLYTCVGESMLSHPACKLQAISAEATVCPSTYLVGNLGYVIA